MASLVKRELTRDEESRLFSQLRSCFAGELSSRKIAQLLRLSLDELSAKVLAAFALYCIDQLEFGDVYPETSIDLCGTGGDSKQTLNISTATAILVASTGVVVQKNGSGSSTSSVGSSDLLRTLGIVPAGTSDEVAQSIERYGGACLHAPDFYPQLAALARRRKLLRGPSVFNLLGPLLNPTMPTHRLVGAYSDAAAQYMASSLQWLGSVERAFVVYGWGGYDEATPVAPCTVREVRPYYAGVRVVTPREYGLKRCRPKDLRCERAEDSAQAVRRIFSGEDVSAKRDAVVFNAALAFQLLDSSLAAIEAAEKAASVIDSGLAAQYLLRLETS